MSSAENGWHGLCSTAPIKAKGDEADYTSKRLQSKVVDFVSQAPVSARSFEKVEVDMK